MGADLEKRAREILAAEYERRNLSASAWSMRHRKVLAHDHDIAAIAAIRAALEAGQADVWKGLYQSEKHLRQQWQAQTEVGQADSRRLDYIERTFSGMTNRERYLPVQMIWGKGCNGRTLREACDKYMERDAAIAASGERDE